MPIYYEQEEQVDIFEEKEEEKVGLPITPSNTSAAQASFIKGKELSEDYFRIRKDLLLTGESTDIRSIQDSDLEYQEELDSLAAGDILRDPTLAEDEKRSLLDTTIDMQRQRKKTPLSGIYASVVAEHYDDTGAPAYAEMQEARVEQLEQVTDHVKFEIEMLKPQAIDVKKAIGGGGLTDLTMGILEISVPRLHATRILELYTHMMGEEPSLWDELWTGNLYEGLQDKFASLNNQDKVEWAEKMVKYFKGTEGWLKDQNAFEIMTTLESLLDVDKTADDFNWDKLIENIIVPLDAIALAGWARLGLKGVASTLGTATRTNPDLAAKMASAALLDGTDEAMSAMGTSRKELVLDIYFPGKGHRPDTLTGAPSDLPDLTADMAARAGGIFERYVTDNPTTKRLLKEIVERNNGGTYHINKSWVTTLDKEAGKYAVSALVGATASRGYSTAQGAIRAAKRRDSDVLGLWMRNKSGEVVRVRKQDLKADDKPTKGEFFYENRTTEYLPPESLTIDFAGVTPARWTSARPESSKYFSDVNALFTSKDSLKLGALSDLEAVVRDKITKIDPLFKSLNKADQLGAVTLLAKGAVDMGDGVPGVIRWTDAIAGTNSIPRVSPASYQAYLGLVQKSDLTYLVMNDRVRKGLLDKTFDALEDVDGVLEYGHRVGGKDLSNTLNGIEEVINITTGRPMKLTQEIKASLNTRTSFLYKLRSEARSDGTVHNYMYVPSTSLNKIKPIPKDPLPYIDGYVYRRHEDRFYVELTNKVQVDGKPGLSDRSIVVGAAKSQKEALDLMESLKPEFLGDPTASMGVRFGREMVKDMSDGRASYELALANGLVHKGKRGPMLEKSGGLENVLPTFEAIESSIHKAAAHLTNIPVIEQAEKDFVKFFGDKAGILTRNNDGGYSFPLNRQAIPVPKGANPETMALYNKAVASWDYIFRMGRYEDPLTAGWRGTIFKLATMVDAGPKGHKLAEVIGRKDPLDVAKSYAFLSFIATNPFRQLPLQLSQHLMLMPMAPVYMGSGTALKNAMAMSLGGTMRHIPDTWKRFAPGLAKVRGLSLKEYAREVDEWLDTGLSQSIDSHTYSNSLHLHPTQTIGRKAADAVVVQTVNAFKFPIRLARTLGFNAGEIGNLATTYQVLKHLDAKNGVTHNPLTLGQRTRQTTFTMNNMGEFGYQRGFLKGATQFMSFQHKALAAILGANPAFTRAQRAQIAGTQTLLFGASAFGLGGLYLSIAKEYEERFNDTLDPRLHHAVITGVSSALVNAGLEEVAKVYGLDSKDVKGTHTDFSSFAPFGGATFAVGSIWDMMFADKSSVELAFGASASALSRTSDAVKTTMDMWGIRDPEEDKTELVLESLKILGRGVSSGLSNYYKGMIAEEAKAFIDKHGNEIAKATLLEAYNKALLGLGTYDETVYYYAKHDLSAREFEEREQVRRQVAAMFHLYDARDKQDLGAVDKAIDRLSTLNQWLHLTSNDHGERFRALVKERYFEVLQRRSGRDDLMQQLMRRAAGDLEPGAIASNTAMLAEVEESRFRLQTLLNELFVEEPKDNFTYDEEKE